MMLTISIKKSNSYCNVILIYYLHFKDRLVLIHLSYFYYKPFMIFIFYWWERLGQEHCQFTIVYFQRPLRYYRKVIGHCWFSTCFSHQHFYIHKHVLVPLIVILYILWSMNLRMLTDYLIDLLYFFQKWLTDNISNITLECCQFFSRNNLWHLIWVLCILMLLLF